ncbi:MAG: pseudaminic acid cytidylyltransferase [Succinivibrio sp.]
MSVIAIIPARGGSKRIPHKNIKDFNGRPLISYPIKAALDSKIFDKVIVSTDDEEIAEVAKNAGAECPFMRDKNLSDDFTGTYDVVKDAFLRVDDGSITDVFCIYATAPLLKAEHLVKAFDVYKKSEAMSLTSVCEFPFPIQRAFVMDENHCISFREPENASKRSQDLRACYQDCGQFYIYDAKLFKGAKLNFTVGYELPRHRVIDIDTPEDWDYARALYNVVEDLKLD